MPEPFTMRVYEYSDDDKRRTKRATIALKNNDVARGRAHQNQSLDGSEDSEAEDLTLDLATYSRVLYWRQITRTFKNCPVHLSAKHNMCSNQPPAEWRAARTSE
jgi:hypothetical protein